MSVPEIPAEEIVAFVLGESDPETAEAIRVRMLRSPALKAAVEDARQVIGALETDDSGDPPAPVRQRALALLGRRAERAWADRLAGAVRAVVALVYDSRLEPAFAGFRGGVAALQFTCGSELGKVEFTIDRRRAAAAGAAWVIQGQLSLAAPATPEVILVRTGTTHEVARARADERGYFRLAADAGVYDVVVDLDPRPLLITGLSIGER